MDTIADMVTVITDIAACTPGRTWPLIRWCRPTRLITRRLPIRMPQGSEWEWPRQTSRSGWANSSFELTRRNNKRRADALDPASRVLFRPVSRASFRGLRVGRRLQVLVEPVGDQLEVGQDRRPAVA